MTVQDKVWSYDPRRLDPTRIIQNYPELKPHAHSTHESGRKQHEVALYSFKISTGPDIFLHWSVCFSCAEVRNKYIIGYDNDLEDGNNGTAYLRDLIKNGRDTANDIN